MIKPPPHLNKVNLPPSFSRLMVPTLLKAPMFIKVAVALIVLLAPIVIMDYRDALAKWWVRFRQRRNNSKTRA